MQRLGRVDMKSYTDSWRNYLKEGVVSPPGIPLLISNSFQTLRKMSLGAIKYQDKFIEKHADEFRVQMRILPPKYRINYGSASLFPGSSYNAYATYNVIIDPSNGKKTGMITFNLTMWEGLIEDINNQITKIIEQGKRSDYAKNQSVQDPINTISLSEQSQIESHLIEFASMLISITLVHEWRHYLDSNRYARKDFSNPKYNRYFEAGAHEWELEQTEAVKQGIPSLVDSLFSALEPSMRKQNADDQDVALVRKGIESYMMRKVEDSKHESHRMFMFYSEDCIETEDQNCLVEDEYVVKKGDSLWKIAKRYGVDFRDILQVNSSLKDPNKIYVGQIILIPQSMSDPERESVITVASN